MMSSVLSFLRRQLFITPTKADPSKVGLRGQVGLVTGSNCGLGFEAAKQLLALELSTLILAVRSQERGDQARRELVTLYPDAAIEVSILDMDSYESIQAFVARCKVLPRLDFAILNAGIIKFTFEQNKNTGHEETVQVNVLSTALLTSLLLPVMASKPYARPGKITIVGSETAEWAAFKERKDLPLLPQLDIVQGYDATERYYLSKLLLQLYIVEAAKRVNPEKVILNLANPGFCYGSQLHREVPGAMGHVLGGVKRAIGRTCEVGARPIVKAAVVEGILSHGKFYMDNDLAEMAPMARGSNEQKYGPQVYSEIMEELKECGIERAVAMVGSN